VELDVLERDLAEIRAGLEIQSMRQICAAIDGRKTRNR